MWGLDQLPRNFLISSFLAYIPLSLAINRGYSWQDALIGGTVSLVYAGLFTATNARVNDYFDRKEDVGYKDNPFDEDGTGGLAFIAGLQCVFLLVALIVALVYDIRIILFSVIALILSWWYSDNIYMPRVVGFRLKSHYAFEVSGIVVGYLLAFASTLAINHVLTLWSLPFFILVTMTFVHEILVKDIPQVEKDSKVGNTTLPVVYGVGPIWRLGEILRQINYLALAVFSVTGLFPLQALLGLVWVPLDELSKHIDFLHVVKMLFLRSLRPYYILICLGVLLSTAN